MTEMPTLTGTDKQTRWADNIRRDLITEVDAFEAKLRTAAENKPGQDHLVAAIVPAMRAKLAETIAEHTDAAWWIDNRFAVFTQIKKAGSVAAHAIQAAR